MSGAPSCKSVISFLWTNAIVVGALVFLLFTFIDPADIAIALNLDIDEGVFRIQAYTFSFIFLWLAFAASAFLNCYLTRLMYQMNMQDTAK